MQNINLNIGGLIGAVSVLIVCGIVFAVTDVASGENMTRTVKIMLACVIAGAVGGTILWAKIFPKT